MIRLFVGLGNPGSEYEDTRHNAGFAWLDLVAQELKIPFVLEKSFRGLVAKTTINGLNVWLLKPQTFMNLSGQSVAALARFFKLESTDILVAHDELDLPPGEVKVKISGGHAGHNGLRDIHSQLGTNNYWRLRIGIGHPGDKSDVSNWVLKKPSIDHQIAINQSLVRAQKAMNCLLTGDMEKAKLLIHTSKPARPKPIHTLELSESASMRATSKKMDGHN